MENSELLKLSDDEIAIQLTLQPVGINPLDWGLRTLIDGPDETRYLPRAKQILSTASYLTMSTDELLKGFALRLYLFEIERRDPNADMTIVKPALEATIRKIEEMTTAGDMVKFGALLGDSWYNLGIACRMTREYEMAAQCQQKAASYYTLSGQPDKAWSSLFLVVVKRATATVVETGDEAEITKAFNALIHIRNTVEYLFPGDKMPGWLKGNRQPHCLLAAIWADKEYTQMRDDIEMLLNSGKKNHLTALAEVVAASTSSTTSTAERVADAYRDFPSSSTGNGVLSALLLGAKYANDADKRRIYERILSWTGNDGAAPMAVARRMLAKLGA